MKTLKFLVFLGLAWSSTLASAQVAGTWSVKGGYNYFYSKVDSGDITGVPGGKVDVSDAGNVFGGVSYMFTDNIAAEFVAGSMPKHDVYGAGTISAVGKIGTVKFVPVGLTAQYHFLDPQGDFRPFIGVTLLRAMFRDCEGTPALTAITNPGGPATTLSVEDRWGYAFQFGVSYSLNRNWFIDGTVNPMFINTKASLSTGQTVDVKFHPTAVNFAVGYHF